MCIYHNPGATIGCAADIKNCILTKGDMLVLYLSEPDLYTRREAYFKQLALRCWAEWGRHSRLFLLSFKRIASTESWD